MPLPGPCVLVTRPQPQADAWVAQLQALGLCAAALPLLDIAPPVDPAAVLAAWRWLAGAAGPGRPAQPAAACPALVMFVSPNAAERFFALKPPGQSWPPGVIAAGTGPGTRRALLHAGVAQAELCTPPEPHGLFDSETLWLALRSRVDWAGRSALIVRGQGGRDWLADTLRQHGASVHFVEAYRRTTPVPAAASQRLLHQAISQPAAYLWLFSSSQALAGLGQWVQAAAPGHGWGAARALATHPRIAEAARKLGFGSVKAVAPLPEAVRQALSEEALPAGGLDTIR